MARRCTAKIAIEGSVVYFLKKDWKGDGGIEYLGPYFNKPAQRACVHYTTSIECYKLTKVDIAEPIKKVTKVKPDKI